MKKKKKVYCCNGCGFEAVQWLGKCPQCGLWNTFEELDGGEQKRLNVRKRTAHAVGKKDIKPLNEVVIPEKNRLSLGNEELNRIIGGGVPFEATVLLAGEPGIGKSTLLLQMCATVAKEYARKVVYVSAEESLQQIKIRSERLGISGDNVYVVAESELDVITTYIHEAEPILVIVDSVQAVHEATIPSPAGTLSQVRECASQLCRLAKERGFALFLIGHVTKDGTLAGPKSLEHLVDTVINFEGDRYQQLRLIRTIKNRYGATGDVGIFEMTEKGLREVTNPSSIFLPTSDELTPGRVTAAILEGRRPFLIEIQALTNKTPFSNPLRRAVGVEQNQISLLLAVLERSLKMTFVGCDVFVKVVGGLKLQDASCDLPLCLAIISSFTGIAIPAGSVVVGEVGLGGEIRKVHNIETRIKEAARLGFCTILIPKNNTTHSIKGIGVKEVSHITEVYNLFFKESEAQCT